MHHRNTIRTCCAPSVRLRCWNFYSSLFYIPHPSLSTSDRTQKLKDARSEASKEIEQLKSNKEKEFNDFQKEVSSYASHRLFQHTAILTIVALPNLSRSRAFVLHNTQLRHSTARRIDLQLADHRRQGNRAKA